MIHEPRDTQMHFAQDYETEKLKQWWKRNGTGIVAGIVIGVGGVSGIQGWRMYQDYQSGQASLVYEQMLVEVAKEDHESVARAADHPFSYTHLTPRNSNTVYTAVVTAS